MFSHRKIATGLCCVSISLSLVAMPCKIVVSGASLTLSLQTAEAAKGGNGGGGNGGGGGGGNSGGNSGNSNGGGNGGGNGNGGGTGGGNGNSNGNSSSGSATKGSAADADDTAGSVMEVRHRDGMSELIRNGRYIMRDARGRTIVNRRATSADETRLESFTH
ncbi:hypothetical protein ATY81_17290 [Rhizobium sp. R72]|uniref:hypothetical protein n=1 Tax=unclassified Rhizobium TaxID=2613769 RepID=UPI000B765341|nr:MULTISPECIES: hypothetical protein [unclassified Rhizobium]OWW04216.1 hypothetical protein ATY81_17290 [Rhizobium sp. R72]OWW04419.1 hypothetical protein ATY80_17290 [Rhizobium sp. R711]